MPVLRLCSEARLQVLRSWCRQQAKHIPFDGQKGSGALRILPGWPPNWLWGSWCTALNGSKRHVHRRLQARVTRSPQKLAHYQTVSYLGRNGYETGTKRVRNGYETGWGVHSCRWPLLQDVSVHFSFACSLVGTLRLPISDDLLTLGRWGHRASNGNKT